MEIWRDVKGYEGLYQVSTKGNVKSVRGGRWKTGKKDCLTPVITETGYVHIRLSKDGKQKTYSVHRLVAQTFIPNPFNLETVNHIDEDKTNNNVDNLEWMTMKENINYGSHNKRMASTLTNGPLSKMVNQYSVDDKLIKTFPSICEVRRVLGFATGNISKCCKGILKSAYGFKWKYA